MHIDTHLNTSGASLEGIEPGHLVVTSTASIARGEFGAAQMASVASIALPDASVGSRHFAPKIYRDELTSGSVTLGAGYTDILVRGIASADIPSDSVIMVWGSGSVDGSAAGDIIRLGIEINGTLQSETLTEISANADNQALAVFDFQNVSAGNATVVLQGREHAGSGTMRAVNSFMQMITMVVSQ